MGWASWVVVASGPGPTPAGVRGAPTQNYYRRPALIFAQKTSVAPTCHTTQPAPILLTISVKTTNTTNMVQPTPYAPTYSFTDHASGSPGAQPPGVPLDIEFDKIAATILHIINNLSKIQRDDTTLRSNSVGIPQLDGAALALISGGTYAIKGVWETAENYQLGDFVAVEDLIYVVVIPHVSGVFATDLASNKLIRAFNPEVVVPPVIIPSTAFATLEALKASDPALLSYSLTDPELAGVFFYETANAPYIADNVNTIKLDNTALSVGALVRQTGAAYTGQALAAILAAASGADKLGFSHANTYAAGTIGNHLKRFIVITDAPYSADGTGTIGASAAIQAALDANLNNADIIAPAGATFLIDATIVFPLLSKNIRLIGYGARFVVTGTHSCIDITAQNENYGWHSIEGLTLIGPNNYYGASMANSTGFGIGARRTANMNNACYNSVIRDCNIEGFEYGIRLRNAIKLRVEGKTFIQFNNYGIYIDGEVVNANNFNDVVISRNAVAGVYSAETVVSPAPTNNVFSGCLLESNHPYLVVPVTGGVAVYLDNAYDYIFDNCYTEDHEFSFRIVGGSKGNKFINCRVAPGGFGEDAISIEGADTWGNVFENCKSATVSRTTPNVYTDNAGQLYNQFINCEGFNFISPNVVKMPYVQNMRPVDYSSTLGGMGYLGIPEHGMRENAFEGTVPGTITGIGTATATLNCFGLGEILISDAVAAAGTNTTITTFTGLQKGQMLVVWNYQTARDVTIKSGTIFDAIVLKNATDATFTDFGQMIVFYVNQYGRAYEVGRNF